LARIRLLQEPFVSGSDVLIDKATEFIPNASNGFILIFSHSFFPEANLYLKWIRSAEIGNWYYSKEFNMEGWLCPALFKYFEELPETIYVKIKSFQSHPING